MKKTLIITLEFPPTIGGIATYVHDLANALDPVQTIVLAPYQKDTGAWDKDQKYRIIRRKLLFPRFLWPRWIKLFFLARRIVKKEHIQLLMIHHVLPAGYVGMFLKKLSGVPFLLFSHGTDLVAGTKTPWKKRMVRRVSARALQIIFNSESLQQRYLRVFPEFERLSSVVYPCPETIFMDAQSPEEIGHLRRQYALEGKKVLLSVSRLTDGKGFPHMIRIMPRVLKEVPHLAWFIIGDGEKRGDIMARIQELHLQNIVRYIGQLPHEKLPPYYAVADLFVLLTHPDEGKEEGLGLVFLEAAAAGIPIIAGKSGGVEEAVLHEKTGLVVDVYRGDPAVAESIVRLLKDPAYAKTLGEAGRQRIREEFQWWLQVKRLDPWIGE